MSGVKRMPGKPYRWEVLERFIKEKGWEVGAEIGVYEGKTFLYLLEHCPNISLIGVDTWEAHPELIGREEDGANPHIVKDMDVIYEKFMDDLADVDEGWRSVILREDSVLAAQQVGDETLDFVFIDACHLYESVKADIEAWYPKVKKGGYLLGHDSNFPSVMQALDELLPEWEETTNQVWYIEKC